MKKRLLTFIALSILAGCSASEEEGPIGPRISVLPEHSDIAVSLRGQKPYIPAPIMNSDWGQAGGLAFRDVGNLVGPDNLDVLWKSDIGNVTDGASESIAQPVIFAGQIYVMTADLEVVALDSRDGKELWRQKLTYDSENGTESSWLFGLWKDEAEYEDANSRGGGLVAEGGFVFVTTGTGKIYGLSAEDGKVIWSVDNRVPFGNAPTLFNGKLYVVDRDNRLQVFDALSGRSLWDYRALPEVASYPYVAAPSVIGDVIIAPFTSGEIVALDDKTAKAAWGRNIIGSSLDASAGKFNTIAAHPVISQQKVFVSVPSGLLVALGGANGKIIWQHEIALDKTPLSVGNALFAVDIKDRLIALRKDDGRIFYVSQLPEYLDEENKEDPIAWGAPVMVNNKIIIFSDSEMALQIDPLTGEIIKQFETASTHIDPSIAKGVLYMLGKNGTLYAYENK